MAIDPQRASAGSGRSNGLAGLTTPGLLLFFVGAALPIFFGMHTWILVVRWIGLVAIAAGGWRRSLTYWIFFSMLLGAEIGFDKPHAAEHLRLLSDIFLRLIKVIVAPLILGTLVTGIAGHGDEVHIEPFQKRYQRDQFLCLATMPSRHRSDGLRGDARGIGGQ